jgi:DNA sulfur modification protein DndD
VLTLRRLEVKGFGPFADEQVLEFPKEPGVTVVYGDNMRGKTSLLNAVRYAFFGKVLGRGARGERRLHTISNRELSAQGIFGFSVVLVFRYGDQEYELIRECRAKVAAPTNDGDYEQEIMLRKGQDLLGPQERDRELQQIFPNEVSRFFLFDGELLQEYEELLISESEAGPRISEAIERILGVPILKRARVHLTRLSEEADKQAARDAQRKQETQAIGTALQQAMERREAHQKEHARLQAQLKELTGERVEIEQLLQSTQRYAGILQDRDDAELKLLEAEKEEKRCRGELQAAMADGWRSLVREPVRNARATAQAEAQKEMESYALSLRSAAIDKGHCSICDQDVSQELRRRLRASMPAEQAVPATSNMAAAIGRLADLNRFSDTDNAGEVRQLYRRLNGLQLEQVTLKDRIADLKTLLADADPDSIRHSKASILEITEKIAAVRKAIDDVAMKAQELDLNIQRLKKKLEAFGGSDLGASQLRAKVLREGSEIFGAAVERFKSDLRQRVEETASRLFRSMTTEKQDYAGLTINEGYGLTIQHRDGRAEEARSAGAEHVVALALMGALQHNAALRGPIVMDSPFGRLDDKHTSNVIQTLPQMAEQVILLVYEAEVGKDRVRRTLGNRLIREYELERVSARRTNIVEIK